MLHIFYPLMNTQQNIPFTRSQLEQELDRRRPGQSKITTSRTEGDKVVFMSGIFEGKTTGTPIGFTISNNNFKSEDYDKIKR